ncbi:olfactory receptor 11A1-like [Menidia menidia]
MSMYGKGNMIQFTLYAIHNCLPCNSLLIIIILTWRSSMEAERNVTFITLDGFVQLHEFRYLYFVILFPVYILILCFNFTIVFLVVFRKSLHEPMYIFIAALLLNSALFSTVVFPKLLIDVLLERRTVPLSACFFQSFMFYTLGSSEFLLLTVMSFDRYVSICKPLQYPTVMRKRTVSILLALAWAIPAFYMGCFELFILKFHKQICSFTIEGIFCNSQNYNMLCSRAVAIDILSMIILVNVALLPVTLICFSYTRIMIISYHSCKEVRRKAAQTCLPHLLVLISFSSLVASDVIVVYTHSDLSKTVKFVMSLQVIMYNPLFNPIIYGLKMKEISKQIKKLLCSYKIN